MAVQTLQQPPPELADAIGQASTTYGVPVDLLTGIWRVESGGSYPNPYANGLGYGGEFGTRVTAPFGSAKQTERISEPPVSQQADLAASILHNALVRDHGSISKALSDYSGGGYTSVPGETTFGSLSVGGAVAEPSYTGGSSTPTSDVSLTGVLGGAESATLDLLFRAVFLAAGIGLAAVGLILLVRAFGGGPLERAVGEATVVGKVASTISKAPSRRRDEAAYRERQRSGGRPARQGVPKRKVKFGETRSGGDDEIPF